MSLSGRWEVQLGLLKLALLSHVEVCHEQMYRSMKHENRIQGTHVHAYALMMQRHIYIYICIFFQIKLGVVHLNFLTNCLKLNSKISSFL